MMTSAVDRVAPHLGELLGVERSLLVQDAVGHADLADVVQRSQARQQLDPFGRQVGMEARMQGELLAEQLATHPRFRDYLTPERIDLLSSLAPLHDIGKVGVPDRLLNKPGALTDEEFAEMRKHPSYGRDVILKAEREVGASGDAILAMAKDIVYTHHEKWDGSGYPQGLRGTEIPIPGRVIALVDVYDALLARRVYRQPIPHAEAVAVIRSGSGTHFNPAVVEAFLAVASALERQSVSEVQLTGKS